MPPLERSDVGKQLAMDSDKEEEEDPPTNKITQKSLKAVKGWRCLKPGRRKVWP